MSNHLRSPSISLISLLWFVILLMPSMPVAGLIRSYTAPPTEIIIADSEFPADAFLRSQAVFWFAIYHDLEEDEGLLHDSKIPTLIYGKVKAKPGNEGSSTIKARVDEIKEGLQRLAEGDSTSPELEGLRRQLPLAWDSAAIVDAQSRVRFQRGLKSRFRAGIERSYKYLPHIDSLLRSRGLPGRLKYLPHVESCFEPRAYSKVGAAGMWQLMAGTVRRKVAIGSLVDERRDPWISTDAAAQVLSHNIVRLKVWPVALTAYNHGPNGMARAVSQVGTADLTKIIHSYTSSSFGFASRNFYAEFLAASTIAIKADSLYPGLRKSPPVAYQSMILESPIDLATIAREIGLPQGELESYNLALRPDVIRQNRPLPKGYRVRLPADLPAEVLGRRLAGMAKGMPMVAHSNPKISPLPTAAAFPGSFSLPGRKPVALLPAGFDQEPTFVAPMAELNSPVNEVYLSGVFSPVDCRVSLACLDTHSTRNASKSGTTGILASTWGSSGAAGPRLDRRDAVRELHLYASEGYSETAPFLSVCAR